MLPHKYLSIQLRPPMPAVYLYLLDVTHNAIDTGQSVGSTLNFMF